MKLRLTVDDLRPSPAGFSSSKDRNYTSNYHPVGSNLVNLHTTCSVSPKWPLKYLILTRHRLFFFFFFFFSFSWFTPLGRNLEDHDRGMFPFDCSMMTSLYEFGEVSFNGSWIILILISILVWKLPVNSLTSKYFINEILLWFEFIYYRRRILRISINFLQSSNSFYYY